MKNEFARPIQFIKDEHGFVIGREYVNELKPNPMSNTNKVPSAEEIILKTLGLASFLDRYGVHGNVIEAMKQHTRLHLEAMRDEIALKAECINEGTYGGDGQVMDYYVVDKKSIIEAANTYIKNNKL